MPLLRPMILVLVASVVCQIALSQTSASNQTPQQSTAPAPTNSSPATDRRAAEPQTAGASQSTGTAAAGGSPNPTPGDVSGTVAQQVKNVKAIKDALSADSDLDFSLVIGIGSLIVVSGSTDYSDQSNVIHSNNLGKATPQFLAGVAFRSPLPNILPRYHGCAWEVATSSKNSSGVNQPQSPSAAQTSQSPSAAAGTTPAPTTSNTPTPPSSTKTDNATKIGSACGYAEPWQKRPWNAFVSVKFEPGSSQTIGGYVFGASYSITKYLSALVGFALTPVNEPAPGFRTAAAQYVIAQQKLGQDLNFNSTAMINNSPNAFDGFPVTNSAGQLIYTGNPLTVHYHGGAVFGVSIPIYFSSAFK